MNHIRITKRVITVNKLTFEVVLSHNAHLALVFGTL